MCELFGLNTIEPVDCTSELEEFFSHSDHNKDGWGIFRDDTEQTLLKEPKAALKSKQLRSYLNGMTPCSNVIGHIRFGTHGSVAYENCHPFQLKDLSGRTWTLAHNGVVYYESSELKAFTNVQTGRTDSERLLHYIISRVNESIDKVNESLESRISVVDSIIIKMDSMGWVNLLIWDEEVMYAYCNRPFSLHYSANENGVMFSSKPLQKHDGVWEPMRSGQLLVFKRGGLMYDSWDDSTDQDDTEAPAYVCHLTRDDVVNCDGHGGFDVSDDFEDKMLDEAINEGWDIEFVFDDDFDPYYAD